MVLFLIFIMAAGLAPNIHSHLIFRFLAGFFGSTPLSCAGGTVADLWNPVQKTYAFPAYAIPSFLGPMAGQIIGSYIPVNLGWRWLEWIMLIMGGAILVIVLLFQPETYGPLLLYWKAKILREETGDKRYKAPMEMKNEALGPRLLASVYRPFALVYSELIIILMSLYLTVVYIVLFTFLEGYTYVFGHTYGLSQQMTSILWVGMLCGILLVSFLVPVVYSWTAKEYKKTSSIAPEMRLWYAMLGGAPAVPISLFWMGWTSYVSTIAHHWFIIVSFADFHSRCRCSAIHLDLVSSHCIRRIRIRNYCYFRLRVHVYHRFLWCILSICIGVPCFYQICGCRRHDGCWWTYLPFYRCSLHADHLGGHQYCHGRNPVLALCVWAENSEIQQICC
jgi:MFS family permease